MMPTPSLQVLVCTIGSRVGRLSAEAFPVCDGVGYLLSWQRGDGSGQLPGWVERRRDFTVTRAGGRGLSANRNHALRHATAPLLLLADDDVSYRPAFFDALFRAFRAHPQAAVLILQAVDTAGCPLHFCPPAPYVYPHRPRGAHFCSVEIALRRSAALPPFDERFGLGAPVLGCGEEEVFVHDAYRRGLRVCYEPVVVVCTPRGTTGSRFLTDAGVQRAKGAVLCHIHGLAGALARCLRCVLTQRGAASRWRLWCELVAGIRYYRRTSRRMAGRR